MFGKISSKFVAVALLVAVVVAALPFALSNATAQYTGTAGSGNIGGTSTDPDAIVATRVKLLTTPVREGFAFGRLLTGSGVGNSTVLNIPYIRAVDVFVFDSDGTTPWKGDFAESLLVCLRGSGRLLFASVDGQGRQFFGIPTVTTVRSGYLCAFLSEPGTLALVAQ